MYPGFSGEARQEDGEEEEEEEEESSLLSPLCLDLNMTLII